MLAYIVYNKFSESHLTEIWIILHPVRVSQLHHIWIWRHPNPLTNGSRHAWNIPIQLLWRQYCLINFMIELVFVGVLVIFSDISSPWYTYSTAILSKFPFLLWLFFVPLLYLHWIATNFDELLELGHFYFCAVLKSYFPWRGGGQHLTTQTGIANYAIFFLENVLLDHVNDLHTWQFPTDRPACRPT